MSLILISVHKSFAWAFERVLLKPINSDIAWNEDFFRQRIANADCSSAVAIVDTSDEQDIQKWLWEIIRIELQCHAPFIALGFEDEKRFLDNPKNLIFVQRSPEYAYLKKPLSLKKFIHTVNKLQPLYDEKTLDSHIRKYSRTEGLIRRYLHDVDNAIRNREINKCIKAYQKIKELQKYIEMDSKTKLKLEDRIENFILAKNFKDAKLLSKNLYELLEGLEKNG